MYFHTSETKLIQDTAIEVVAVSQSFIVVHTRLHSFTVRSPDWMKAILEFLEGSKDFIRVGDAYVRSSAVTEIDLFARPIIHAGLSTVTADSREALAPLLGRRRGRK